MLKESKVYFENFAKEWVKDAYSDPRRELPIGEQRKQIIKNILNSKGGSSLNILDIGCGGGQITKELLALGHIVTAVDRSEKMLALLEEECLDLPMTQRANLEIIQSCATVLEEKIVSKKYDVIICIGMIYYLENDEPIYHLIANHLRSNGVAVVTFRNELFNMFLNSKYKHSEAQELYSLHQEINSVNKKIDVFSFQKYLILLRIKIDEALILLNNSSLNASPQSRTDNLETSDEREQILGRQYTPEQVVNATKKFKLNVNKFYGIQPHFMLASAEETVISECLQLLSTALWPLCDAPVSLLWSSHFLTEIRHS